MLVLCKKEQSDKILPNPIKFENTEKLLVETSNYLGYNYFRLINNNATGDNELHLRIGFAVGAKFPDDTGEL